jgi:hypothetical protein
VLDPTRELTAAARQPTWEEPGSVGPDARAEIDGGEPRNPQGVARQPPWEVPRECGPDNEKGPRGGTPHIFDWKEVMLWIFLFENDF